MLSVPKVFAAFIAFAIIPASAIARPWLYVSSFTYTGKLDACLDSAKKALTAAGFTQDLEISKTQSSKSGHVEGLLQGEPVRAQIECNPSEGISALGVSGLENEITYNKYFQLYKSQW